MCFSYYITPTLYIYQYCVFKYRMMWHILKTDFNLLTEP